MLADLTRKDNMKSDLTLSEAFELYRKDVIVYKNQSAKTEEMNNCAMKSIINFLGDIPITDLSFDAVRKWTADLRKTRTSNTVRGYILKIRVVLKHLRALGYEDILDPEAVGIPKRDSRVVDYLEVEEVQAMLKAVFRKGGRICSNICRKSSRGSRACTIRS